MSRCGWLCACGCGQRCVCEVTAADGSPLPDSLECVEREVRRAAKAKREPMWPPNFRGPFHEARFAPLHPAPDKERPGSAPVVCGIGGCWFALGHRCREHSYQVRP